MRLTEEQAIRVQKEYLKIAPQLRGLPGALLESVLPHLRVERAREYLAQGVARRAGLIGRCLENIFRIFPPERTALLSHEELGDVTINLHALVINVYGLLDNVAWVFVLERQAEAQIKGGRAGVGLFNKATHEYLPPAVLAYVSSDTIKAWFNEYAKNYRDALAHRIPLYVPPFSVRNADEAKWKQLDSDISKRIFGQDFDAVERLKDEQEALQTICTAFTHSYSDSDASRPVVLHAQLICDAMTVVELLAQVSEGLKQGA